MPLTLPGPTRAARHDYWHPSRGYALGRQSNGGSNTGTRPTRAAQRRRQRARQSNVSASGELVVTSEQSVLPFQLRPALGPEAEELVDLLVECFVGRHEVARKVRRGVKIGERHPELEPTGGPHSLASIDDARAGPTLPRPVLPSPVWPMPAPSEDSSLEKPS